jgi:uncharacterized protein (DUF433 family)
MNWRDRIEVNPDVCFGKPHIKGTRLSVEFVMARFAEGWSEADVLESYPRLTRADLQALFALAAEMLSEENYVITGKLVA